MRNREKAEMWLEVNTIIEYTKHSATLESLTKLLDDVGYEAIKAYEKERWEQCYSEMNGAS